MAKQILLTKQGLEALQEELDDLKVVKRKEIAEKIKIALSFGDLSENSEYDEAKNDQAKIENRINEIEAMLKNAKLIDESAVNDNTVNVGMTFRLLDVEFNEETEYKMVGSAEADPMNGKISDESPIGKAVLGHSAGETVIAITPDGELQFKIVKIIK
ncbi:MAG: transcription elongation factor GreA [Clostridia bacterium]|nr:transcription elongation factor GreA [Clostridia bacterium]MEE1024473.1 transcription elongation factor GreA [Acutalibacteraceae bacterium]